MKKSPLAMFLLVGVLVGCSTTGGSHTGSLFNGRDLAGWVVMDGGGWAVENGVLVGRNGKDWSYETDRLTTGYIDLQNHDSKSVVSTFSL